MLQRFAKLCYWAACAAALLVFVGGAAIGFPRPGGGFDIWPLAAGAVVAALVFLVGAAVHYVVIGPDENGFSVAHHAFAYVFSYLFGFAFWFAVAVAMSAIVSSRSLSNVDFWIGSAAIAFVLQCVSGAALLYFARRQEARDRRHEPSVAGERREPSFD